MSVLTRSRTRFRRLAAMLVAVMLAAPVLLTGPTSTRADAADRAAMVRHAFSVAMSKRGASYQYGAAGPGRFDCSGLVYFSYRKRSGFRALPRTAAAQARFARHISRSRMRPGDLMFFTRGGGVYHVGVYAGNRNGRRMVLEATRPGHPVHVAPMWSNSWFPGTLR